MKRLLPLLSLVALTGCVTATGRYGDLEVTSRRFMWQSEAIEFSVVTSNVVATLKVGSSGVDAEALSAVVDAAVQAAMKSIVPVP